VLPVQRWVLPLHPARHSIAVTADSCAQVWAVFVRHGLNCFDNIRASLPIALLVLDVTRCAMSDDRDDLPPATAVCAASPSCARYGATMTGGFRAGKRARDAEDTGGTAERKRARKTEEDF